MLSQKKFEIVGVILAAGKGLRLMPLTLVTPKPLLIYKNKPLIKYSLDPLSEIVDEYFIVVHWLKNQIQKSLGNSYKQRKITYAFQDNPVGGTLDALKTAILKLKKLKKFKKQSLIISNSDDIKGWHFYELIKKHINTTPDLPAICGFFEKDKSKLSNFGVIKTDSENNFISIHEKPAKYISNLINIGLYYLPDNLIDYALKFEPSFKIKSQKEKYLTDLFNFLPKKPKVLVSESDFISPSKISDIQTL